MLGPGVDIGDELRHFGRNLCGRLPVNPTSIRLSRSFVADILLIEADPVRCVADS